MLALDHVGFACRDLDRILPIFRRVGFSPTEPRALEAVDPATGQTRALGQTSAHIVFRDTYIELSAVPDPATDNHLEPFLARYEGLHILALRDSDLETCHRQIRQHGFKIGDIQSAKRDIQYGRRHGAARFRWFMLDKSASPEGLLCVVDNLTPELVYQHEVMTHANGANRLTGVIICADDTDGARQRFGNILGNGASLANASITIMTPDELAEDYPGFMPPASPCLCGLELRVADINDLADLLEQSDVPYEQLDGDQICVYLPPPANGILIFTQQTGAD